MSLQRNYFCLNFKSPFFTICLSRSSPSMHSQLRKYHFITRRLRFQIHSIIILLIEFKMQFELFFLTSFDLMNSNCSTKQKKCKNSSSSVFLTFVDLSHILILIQFLSIQIKYINNFSIVTIMEKESTKMPQRILRHRKPILLFTFIFFH